MGEEKKKRDLVWIIPVAGTLLPICFVAWELAGAHVHGTTPAQIEALSLEGSPKKVARGLSSTDVEETSVRARFRVSAGKPYEYLFLSWSSKTATAPTSMRLAPADKVDEEHVAEITAALARRFHAIEGSSWRWGPVEITADGTGELRATVSDAETNSLFERQMDAARQVLLEVAFGIPVHASDADLAELLGTGYKTADVGKIDPGTPVEDAPALIAARFPGSLHDTSTRWEIAVDHPLLRSVELHWSNHRGGRMSVQLNADHAYAASREQLQSCLANAIGPSQTKVTDYAANKKDHVFVIGSMKLVLGNADISVSGDIDAASFTKLFDAFAGCRERSENTGARGDGRKK